MVQRLICFSIFGFVLSSQGLLAGDLEEILARHFDARGGQAKLEAIHGMQFSGVVKKHSKEIEFNYTVEGKRCRMEISYGDKKLTKVFDGQKGWQFNPMICSDPQPLTRRETGKMINFAADAAGPLINWQEKGHRLRYLGLQTLAGMQLHTIQIFKKQGQKEIVYLDPNTFLERMVVRSSDGAPPKYFIIKDFEKLNGLTFVKEMVSCKNIECCVQKEKANACRSSRKIHYKVRKINPKLGEGTFVLRKSHKRKAKTKAWAYNE